METTLTMKAIPGLLNITMGLTTWGVISRISQLLVTLMLHFLSTSAMIQRSLIIQLVQLGGHQSVCQTTGAGKEIGLPSLKNMATTLQLLRY